jgi:hypothetical protein
VCFVRASSALGAVRCGGAANVIVSLGDGCTRLRSSGYRNPASRILTLHNACALLPEARARCGNSARRDLCGGCRVTGIPTGTEEGGTSADYFEDGRFSGTGQLFVNGSGVRQQINGSWDYKKLSKDQLRVTLSIDGGPRGMPLSESLTTTTFTTSTRTTSRFVL